MIVDISKKRLCGINLNFFANFELDQNVVAATFSLAWAR